MNTSRAFHCSSQKKNSTSMTLYGRKLPLTLGGNLLVLADYHPK
jgi:hypothetical protein